MTVLTNIDMSEFWNGAGGQNWLRFQTRLEKSLKVFGQHAMTVSELNSGERVLDIGCGWGDTTFEIAKNIGNQGQVDGIDISDLILEHAHTRINLSESKNISFDCVDAESFTFQSNYYNVIYSRFGVMFFNDPIAAFKNIRQALLPDGRLVFICWQSVNANQWVNLPLEIAGKYVALSETKNPEAPGGFSFGDSNRVLGILEAAGFKNIKIESFETKFIVGADIDDAEIFLSNIGPASSIISDANLETKTRGQIIDELRSTLMSYKSLSGVALNAATWIVTANK